VRSNATARSNSRVVNSRVLIGLEIGSCTCSGHRVTRSMKSRPSNHSLICKWAMFRNDPVLTTIVEREGVIRCVRIVM